MRRVFWVLGGFMFTTGLLTGYLALSSFRQRVRGAAAIAAVAGLTSIGWMAAVNFMIASDFKWPLLAFTFPWAVALVLYWVERAKRAQAALRELSRRRPAVTQGQDADGTQLSTDMPRWNIGDDVWRT